MNRSFEIHLRAADSTTAGLTVDLKVSLPRTYPKTAPTTTLAYGDGLRSRTRQLLADVVENKPRTLLGGEMIYDIAIALQEILDAATHVASELALHEERAQDVELHEAEKLRSEETLQSDLVADMQAKEQLSKEHRQKRLDAERERLRVMRLKDTSPEEPEANEVNGRGGLQFDQYMALDDEKGTTRKFRTVQKLMYFRQGPITKLYQAQIWGNPISAPFSIIVKQCRVKSAVASQIRELESRMEVIRHAGHHSNVHSPLGLSIRRATPDGAADISVDSDLEGKHPTTTDEWTFNIAETFLDKGSLHAFVEVALTVSIDNFRAWAVQLLEGLNFLHRNGIVHGRVHLKNILLEKREGIQAIVRLTDAALKTTMQRIAGGKDQSSELPASWIAPEVRDHLQEQLPVTDMWDLGTCFCRMLFGSNVYSQYSSPAEVVEDLKLSVSLRKMLGQMFRPEPRKRCAAFDLLPSEFLRNDDTVFRDSGVSYQVRPKSAEPKSPRLRRESTNTPSISRYKTDFVELGRLGRGGYGEVVKSRNKLDGRFYAVKKIVQATTSSLDGVLSEIILLSQLNHPFIVRYITAWIETEISAEKEPGYSTEATSEISSDDDDDPTKSEIPPESLDLMSSTGPDIVFGFESDEESDHSVHHSANGSAEEADVADAEQIAELRRLKANGQKLRQVDGYFQSSNVRKGYPANPSEAFVFDDNEASQAVLYIQMEFCEKKTLRSLINGNLQDDNIKSWRLFRQILEALAYIHAADIVHRDLKPENIFIDAVGDIRIGDFGLARPGELRVLQRSKSHRSGIYGSFTKSVGTALYVAPEVRSSSKGSYDDKADMYSLGIVFFEMCFPLTTGMERVTTLTALRQQEHRLPFEFERAEKITQGDIILSLVNHDPTIRPKSSELLHSEKFPMEMEQEKEARDISRSLRDDKTGHLRQKILRAMFVQAEEQSINNTDGHTTYVELSSQTSNDQKIREGSSLRATLDETDFDPKLTLESNSESHLLRQWVHRSISSIFRRHGAVETERPHLIPYAPHFAKYRSSAVRIIGKSGSLLQLPYDLIIPNVHALAKNVRVAHKTYTFATVYRENPGGQVPWTHQEVDFDIVSNNDDFATLHDAECIRVIDEILDGFPSLARIQMCYHLNHSSILDTIFAFCDIPRHKWSKVKETLEKLNLEGYNWAKIRSELRSSSVGLRAISVEELVRFDSQNDLDTAYQDLQQKLPDKDEPLLASAFSILRDLVQYLKRMNIKRKVLINPLSCVNERFYQDNVFFQCIYNTPKKAVFATGGRYDQLIRQYRPADLPRSKVPDRYAVGFSLNWDQICSTMSRFLKAAAKAKNKKKIDLEAYELNIPQRCDVLIEGSDDLLTTAGVALVQDLWANGISAELGLDVAGKRFAYDPSEAPRELHAWTVMLKQDGTAKIRNTAKREEEEMRPSELPWWLLNELRDRDRQEARTTSKAKLLRHPSHPETTSTIFNEREVRAIYNNDENNKKAKKVNRATLVKEASFNAREAMQGIMDSPVVAIECNNELFYTICRTRFTDSDSWRSTIQAAPAEDRGYVRKIQGNMETIAREKHSQYVTMFNFRTKACQLYDMQS